MIGNVMSDGRLLSLQATEWLILIVGGLAGSLILMFWADLLPRLWLRSHALPENDLRDNRSAWSSQKEPQAHRSLGSLVVASARLLIRAAGVSGDGVAARIGLLRE
jgi:arginine utilization protein RocB